MLIKNEGPGYFMCHFPSVYKNAIQLIICEKVNHIFVAEVTEIYEQKSDSEGNWTFALTSLLLL